jgi:hypothetical protein
MHKYIWRWHFADARWAAGQPLPLLGGCRQLRRGGLSALFGTLECRSALPAPGVGGSGRKKKTCQGVLELLVGRWSACSAKRSTNKNFSTTEMTTYPPPTHPPAWWLLPG